MKAVQINKYGGSEVLEVVETSNPIPAKSQVLVEVYAASINPFDRTIRIGKLKDKVPLKFPVIIGGDFAGVVTEVGEGVSDYKKGNEIYGSALVLNGGSGAFAEQAAVNVAKSALKPREVNFEEAASLPLVGSSAVQALEEHIKLAPGQKILIHGGAGGIGSIAIQLAKALGASVATTVSTGDIQFVKGLGADEVVDYKTQKFEEILKDYDAVFNTVKGDIADRSFQVLKKGGIIVSMVGAPNAELAKKHEVTAIGQGTHTNAPHLKRLAELVDSGKIKPQVDKVFSLDQVKEAFDYQEKSSPNGKVVLSLR